MSNSASPDGSARSSTAARELAAILVAVADALDSNELPSISQAMTSVRAGARQLESSLTARGWGGDVLYGWGSRDEDDEGGEDDGDGEDAEDDQGDKGEVSDDIPADAVRFTCQSRADFYLVDEEALIEHNLRRASDLGLDIDREYMEDDGGAFYSFVRLWGLEQMDLTGTGLMSGGSQFLTHQVDLTLWEMDEQAVELRDDAYPTGG